MTCLKLPIESYIIMFMFIPYPGNRVHGNGRTLKDALQSGKCLFSISGDNSYPMHDFYRCLTCESSDSDAICINCVKSCHRDHRVQFVRHDRLVCTVLLLLKKPSFLSSIYQLHCYFSNLLPPSLTHIHVCIHFPPRFFCDCGAGALGCDCMLTGYRAFSSPKISRNVQNHGNPSQPNIAVQQQSTAMS